MINSLVAHAKRFTPEPGAGWPFAFWRPAALHVSDYFRPALRAHFAALSNEDLYLRFGTYCRAEFIDTYVSGIDFRQAAVLAVFDDDLGMIGAAHLTAAAGRWELGLSVLSKWRCRGIGALLLRSAMLQARKRKADTIFVQCLSVNHALIRLVKKSGARVAGRDGVFDGAIAVPCTLPLWVELADEQIGVFHFSVRAHLLVASRVVHQLYGATLHLSQLLSARAASVAK